MAAREDRLIRISGDTEAVVERLRQPLLDALAGRRRYYVVEVETVGRVGEILVRITASEGRLPLLFSTDEQEPGFVSRVVRDTVDRFGL